jgi:RecA-family ATPase
LIDIPKRQEVTEKQGKVKNCCVRYIHHSGKQNGRDKATDQYAGRGGSAFADGCRMVHVL